MDVTPEQVRYYVVSLDFKGELNYKQDEHILSLSVWKFVFRSKMMRESVKRKEQIAKSSY